MPGSAGPHVHDLGGDRLEDPGDRLERVLAPPTMMVRVPFSAAAAPPEMPASRNAAPRSARAACSLMLELGAAVLRSTMTCPAAAIPHASRAEHDRLDDRAVGQRHEHAVAAGDRFGHRSRRGRVRCLCLARHRVVAEYLVARAGQPPRHPAAHVPQADESDPTAVICRAPFSQPTLTASPAAPTTAGYRSITSGSCPATISRAAPPLLAPAARRSPHTSPARR